LKEEAEWLNLQTLAGRMSSIVTLNRPTLKGTVQSILHRKLSTRL
jgi:hypothetical protein